MAVREIMEIKEIRAIRAIRVITKATEDRARKEETKVKILSFDSRRNALEHRRAQQRLLVVEMVCPPPSASPKRLADVHSARLRFFVLSRSGRPRPAVYADSSRS